MLYMNDFDLHRAMSRFARGNTPNRLALTLVVNQLRQWADMHSDGWAYWPKPVRAAMKAMELIESRTTAENQLQEREDITDEAMRLAVRPIRSFLTRQGVSAEDRERILRAVDAPVTA